MVFEEESDVTDVYTNNNLALLGLILVAIAPSVSVITGFAFKAGLLAIFVFIFTKIWIFGLPAFWYLRIEKGEKSLSLPKNGGWKVSVIMGVGMLIVIFIAYFLLGDKLLKADDLTEILDTVGLTVAWKFALAILFTTIVVRSIAWPIYAKSNDLSIKMNVAQPDMQRVQAKYATRKDPQSQQQQQMEMMQIYKKHGINVFGCLLPFLQMPIFIIMYQVVRRVPLSLGETINGVVSKDYSSLNYTFLGMDLKAGVDFSVFSSDGFMAGIGAVFPEIILAILVGVLMFGYQKYAQSKPDYLQNKKYQSEQAAKTANQMKYMSYFMVFMLVSIAITNNGIALYWIVGNGYQFFQTYMNRRSGFKKY